jgi:hypothetical protein
MLDNERRERPSELEAVLGVLLCAIGQVHGDVEGAASISKIEHLNHTSTAMFWSERIGRKMGFTEIRTNITKLGRFMDLVDTFLDFEADVTLLLAAIGQDARPYIHAQNSQSMSEMFMRVTDRADKLLLAAAQARDQLQPALPLQDIERRLYRWCFLFGGLALKAIAELLSQPVAIVIDIHHNRMVTGSPI